MAGSSRGWLVVMGAIVFALVFTMTTLAVLGAGNQVLESSFFTQVQSPGPAVDSELVSLNWPRSQLSTATVGSQVATQPIHRSALAGSDYANCRIGVGVVRNPIYVYTDVAELHIGWYYDWETNTNPLAPAGIEYAQTVRLSQPYGSGGYLPTYTISPPLTDIGLGARVDANPGAMWMVGNEPDVWSQDGITPDQYALAYHEVYHFIKGRDPSARVAVGAIVQPTPLRLQYLDMILDHYYATYGTSMPVDVWNIHMYIIREVRGSWGVQIPPGISASIGIDYPVESHGNLAVFAELVEDFRDWMAKRGQRNKPLIISEMGVLMPEWWQPMFDEDKVIQFMYGAFDYLRSATDPDTGYPADNNHLVQQWNWFSLDDDSVDNEGFLRWNGTLFNSTTYRPTVFGDAFANYTAELSPTVDLIAYQLAQRPLIVHSPTRPMTIELEALIANAGNVPLTDTVSVRFYEITGTGEVQIGSDQMITGLMGCAAQTTRVSIVWPNVAPGVHQIRVRVDPAGSVSEQNLVNNSLDGSALIATEGVFLPAILKNL